MKKLLLGCLILSTATQVSARVIYGVDNRIDTEFSTSPLFKKLADSTAAMVLHSNISIRGNTAEISGPTLGERFNVCSKERFVHQPSAAGCSGFLVAPDIIATAGHCVQDLEACEKSAWVFNYKITDVDQTAISVNTSEVYSCKSIIKRELSRALDTDFALLKLDRPVVGHSPVKLAAKEAVVGTPLVVIGHPSGLPQKIADKARVIRSRTGGFFSNLDTFSINSGSAVFHAESGELLGILVSGDQDYRANRSLGCSEVNVLPESSGNEGVSSFSQFATFLPR